MMRSILKPWFVWRPQQVLARAAGVLRKPEPGARPLRVAWGAEIVADPTKHLGKSIRSTGIYDIAVSEVLARLIRPGDTVVDAGANVGYMTVLAAAAAGPTGRVIAFEPHPELFELLRRNVSSAGAASAQASVETRKEAIGEVEGTADLVLPEEMSGNDGLAYLANGGERSAGTKSIPVRVVTLDSVLGDAAVAVMKLDVEGHELAALRGALRALGEGRLRHIVFEDHAGSGSPTATFLGSMGYRLYSVGWTVRGLNVQPANGRRLARDYEAPSYLATLDAGEVEKRCAGTGWRVLRSRWIRDGRPAQ